MRKTQGMTIKNIVLIKLGQIEIDYKLIHVRLSRVTKFRHIGLINVMPMSRLCKAIAH